MAYQGISPYLYRNNLTNVQLLDDISASFNGTTTQFNLTTNGSPFHAVSARSLLIILGGIVQEPDVDYTVSAGVITFTTAPLSGLTFAARNIYGLNRLTGINDGLVTPASLSLGGPEWDTSGNLTVDGNITQTGETNNVYINTDTPTVRPTLDLNFERDQRLDSRITFSRNSTATYLGSDGLIKTAQPNIPRFEFDTDGNSLGLLIEESRTNVIPYSIDFSNAAWTKINGGTGSAPTVTSNYAISPDGTTTASRIQAELGNGTSSGDFCLVRDSIITDGTDHTWSVWLKSNTTSNQNVIISWYHPDFVSPPDVVTVTPTWKRFTLTKQQVGFETDIGMRGDSTNITRSVDILAWGGQLEDGAFATSYIPTSGSTVTRSADNASIKGTNFSEWYNTTEGTMFTKYYNKVDDGYIAYLNNGTNSNRIALINYTGYQGIVLNDGVSQASIDIGTPILNAVNRISFAFKENDFSVSLNGNIVGNDTLGTLPTVSQLNIGARISDNYLNGHISHLSYYPERLSNDQLQNLTS